MSDIQLYNEFKNQSLTKQVKGFHKFGKKLKDIDHKNAIEALFSILSKLAEYYGIKKTDDFNKSAYSVANLIKSHYSYLTIQEVMKSFEMAPIGKLDEFLPKDSNGHAQRNPFGSISFDFVCKILNAYRDLKKKTLSDSPIKEVSKEISEEEKYNLDIKFIVELIEAFELYRDNGTMPEFRSTLIPYNDLISIGLLDAEKIEASEDDILSTFNRFSDIDKQIHVKPEKVRNIKSIAASELRLNKILECFDGLIENNQDLREIFREKYKKRQK